MFLGKGRWISSGRGKDDAGTLSSCFLPYFCATFLGLYDIGTVYVFAIERMTKAGLVSPEMSRICCFSS